MKSAEIIRAVCDELEVKQSSVMSPRTWTELVDARRRIAIQLRGLKWSYPRIGKLLKRDSSTIHALVNGKARAA